MIQEEFLWVEKYRPKTVADTILPKDVKQTFQQFVDNKNIPNLILSGPPGVGKTTIAKAMLEEIGCDYIVINGSLNGNIDTLRNEIMNFASSVSFTSNRKYVIIDEADFLNAVSFQPAFRNFIEEYSKNCGFIMTCNYKNRIIDAIHSRCSVIDFKIAKKDMATLAKEFMIRVCDILTKENVKYDKSAVAEIIKKYFPDWRRVLNELQRYSATGSIDSGILTNLQEVSLKELMGFLKDKNFTSARKWIVENIDSDSSAIFRKIFDAADIYMEKSSIGQLVILIAKYQYQAAFCADAEVNLAAFIAECMVELEYK